MNNKQRITNKKLLIVLIALIILCLFFARYVLFAKPKRSTHSSNTSHSQTITQNSAQEESPKYPNPYQTTPIPSTNVPGGDLNNNTTNQSLVSPFGQFVSNYGPVSYSATNGSNQEESICQTTIGASCSIVFIQGQTKKALQVQQVKLVNGSQNGVASWSWTPSQVGGNGGLTPGQWEVEAIATLNNQTKITTSNLKLNIEQ
jgi:hypothetical protein